MTYHKASSIGQAAPRRVSEVPKQKAALGAGDKQS